MLEVHFCISLNHSLAMDTRVQQKLTESILWEAIGCVEFTIFFSVCKLCVTYLPYWKNL